MRRYSELLMKPSLIVAVVSGLTACSDNAFKSAIYTDPGRKGAKPTGEIVAVPAPDTHDAHGNRAKFEEMLKHRKKHQAAFDDSKDSEKHNDTSTPVAGSSTNSDDSFSTRRSRARGTNTVVVTTPAPSTKHETNSVPSHPVTAPTKSIQVHFLTESVDGVSPDYVIKSLTGMNLLSTDAALNLETLNQGSFNLDMSPVNLPNRYEGVASLSLVVHVANADGSTDEITKTMPLRNLGNINFNGSDNFEGLMRINQRVIRIRLHREARGLRSGEILLILENGDERKILSLIEQR